MDSRGRISPDLEAFVCFYDSVTRAVTCFARVVTDFAGIPEKIFQHVLQFCVFSQCKTGWGRIEPSTGGKTASFVNPRIKCRPIDVCACSGGPCGKELAATVTIYCPGMGKSRGTKVGRCRLTVSKSVLKVPMVSALETKIC